MVHISLWNRGTNTQFMLGIGRESGLQQFLGTTFQELIHFLIIHSEVIVTFPLLPISEAGSHSHRRITKIRLNSKGGVGRLEYVRHLRGVLCRPALRSITVWPDGYPGRAKHGCTPSRCWTCHLPTSEEKKNKNSYGYRKKNPPWFGSWCDTVLLCLDFHCLAWGEGPWKATYPPQLYNAAIGWMIMMYEILARYSVYLWTGM